MSLTRSDLLFLSLTAGAVAVAAVAFTLDRPTSLRAKDARPVGATVVGRGVERKVDRDVVWEKIGPKEIVYRRDSIRTAKDSAAVLKLQDGSEIRMDGESLIFLDIGDREMRIVFDHGSVGVSRQEGAGGGGKGMALSLQGSGGTVTVEAGASLTAAAKKGESLSVQVESGKATLKSAMGRTMLLEEGKAAEITRGQEEIKVTPVELRLKEPVPAQTVFLDETRRSQAFVFEGSGLTGMTLLLQNDLTGRLVETVPSVVSPWIWEGPREGRYSWWIRGTDSQGRTVESQHRTFSVTVDRGVRLTWPNPGTVFRFAYKAPIIPFSWAPNPAARAYEVRVGSDPSWRESAVQQRVVENRLSLRNLGEGEWYWKVRYLKPDGETWGESPTQSFSVVKELEPEPPVLFYPLEGTRVAAESFGTTGLLLSWKGRSESVRYRLTLEGAGGARRSFVNQSFQVLRETLEPGDWQYRVELVAIREDGSTNLIPSSPRRFTVLPPVPVEKKKTPPPDEAPGAVASAPSPVPGTNLAPTHRSTASSNTNVTAIKPAPVKTPVVTEPVRRPVTTPTTSVEKPTVTNFSAGSNIAPVSNVPPPPKPNGRSLAPEPRDARVLVDGGPWDLGKILPPGIHEIHVEKDGYLSLKTNVTIPAEPGADLKLALRKKRVKGDVIYLIDGTKVTGRMVASDRESITLETGGKQVRIDRIDIDRHESIRDEAP